MRRSWWSFTGYLPAACLLLAGCHPQAYRRGAPFMPAAEAATVSSTTSNTPLPPPLTLPTTDSPVSPAHDTPKSVAFESVIDAEKLVSSQTQRCEAGGPGCAINPRTGAAELQKFSLAYLEFDDAGEFWSIGNEREDKANDTKHYPPSQLYQAIKLIEGKRDYAKKNGKELFVLGFVHGWQNNASPHDETARKNLRDFKSSLQYLATCKQEEKDADGACHRVVVGIFFAWRGRTIYPNGLHVVSYSNRRNVANHVGGPSMTEAVMLLSEATKGTPPAYTEDNLCQNKLPEEDVNTQFLVVGHSFGGRVLEHGVTQPMLALLLERKKQAEDCVARYHVKYAELEMLPIKITPPLDLIVLLNAANDALEAKSTIEAFKRAGLKDSEFKHPVILAVKSAGDSATGWIMRVGQTIAEARPSKRVYDRGVAKGEGESQDKIPSACQQGQLGLKIQTFYYDRSAAGIYNMGSHQIEAVKDIHSNEPAAEQKCHELKKKNDPNRLYFWAPDSIPSGKGTCFQVRTVKSILREDGGRYGEKARQFYSCRPGYYSDPATDEDVVLDVPVWNTTAYYVVNAPTDLIKGHNEIFQVGVLNLIESMMPKERTLTVTPGPITIATQPDSKTRPAAK